MNLEQKQLECPFTWALEKQWVRDFNEMHESDIEFDEEPLLALISSIMITYIRAEKEDYQGAFVNLKATDDIWGKLDKRQLETIGVSKKVLLHIKFATEYYIYDLAKRKVEADHLFKSLESSESFQSILEVATINGCKSVVWSSFHEKAHKESTDFARIATSKSPNCPLWYYILGKSLRHSRRKFFGNLIPLDEEQDATMKSCELSNTPFYKICLAQMYREKKDYWKSNQIYLELFSAKMKSSSILLRLAMGFMSGSVYKDLMKAKKCLDDAGKYRQNCMYHHCFGVYYMKRKEYEKAVEHYRKAAIIGNNYKSDFQYADAQRRINTSFNFVQELESMLIKYDKQLEYKQQILLHIGMRYYFKSMDTGKSLNYFLRAIEVQPESPQLTKFNNVTVDWKIYNIYDFVSKVLQGYEWNHSESSNVERNDLKKLEDYRKQYRANQLSKSVE